MNIQFGSAVNVSNPLGGAQGSDARPGVAVPAETENKSTTSFTSLQPNEAAEKANQDDAKQGRESREAREFARSESREGRKEQREDLQEGIEERRQEESVDQSQVEAAAREKDAQEQRQLEAEIQQIRQLAERDREVKAHEQAHQSVGGQYAGAMSLTYERGPDGKNYAVGGEVPIDTGRIADDPQATLDKAETIRRAALAPAEPSSQDRRVAAQAVQMAVEARADIQQLAREEADVEAQTEETDESDDQGNKERLEAEQKTQKEDDEQQSLISEEAADNLQNLNERLSRIQAQLTEISQIDDKVNSKVNLLDVAT